MKGVHEMIYRSAIGYSLQNPHKNYNIKQPAAFLIWLILQF